METMQRQMESLMDLVKKSQKEGTLTVAWWPGGAWGPRPPLLAKIMGRSNTKGRQ